LQHIKGILDATRKQHTQAVSERIESVEKMKDVVDITKGLFALSKETAKLESEAFVLKQQVGVATELKAVLDSWVRFEQQAKESEQADLAKTVIGKVTAALKDEKSQKDILLAAVAEVERTSCYSNLMASYQGSPVVVDFQSSSRARPSKFRAVIMAQLLAIGRFGR
jgi:F-type H+-transporting ATPase subunit b